MALGPYASAEEKRLFNIEEKLDRILAIVLRKTPEDYTRIAREEAEKNQSIAPTFLSAFTIVPDAPGQADALFQQPFDNEECIDDDIPF
jgi:hypothetical protein